MTVPETAKLFKVHISTVRKRIRQGCPCIKEGSVGRGRGAQLDPKAVEQWLLARKIPTLARQADRDVLTIVATAIYDAWKRDELMGQTLPADYVALKIYERVHKHVTHEPLQEKDLPEEMKRIRANYLDSLERGTFHRR